MNAPLCSDYDVIVVGGGPAGATAAILFAQEGRRVAVVEKVVFPRRKVCGEFVSATTWPLLHALGVSDELARQAGPIVRRVGVFAGAAKITAPIACGGGSETEGGRAVSREVLDTVLLREAAAVGAAIWQPWNVKRFISSASRHSCTVENRENGSLHVLEAPLVVAAHGCWESGPLPTQQFKKMVGKSDLLGFKAHFRGGELDPDLMPLIAFPGGYGGMVNVGGNRISLSCCIRRDQLEICRLRWPKQRAGDAVLAHILEQCTGVAQALSAATCESTWLAAGPIRPGIHGFGREGIVAVGNAAAEAHPVVAEGISIAIQSATLLCEALKPCRGDTLTPESLASAQRQYEQAWRANFASRMRASALYAHLFMHPLSTRLAVAVMTRWPAMLRIGAAWSGKARLLQHTRSDPHVSTPASFGERP